MPRRHDASVDAVDRLAVRDAAVADPAKDPNALSPDDVTESVRLALADSDANARADAVSALGNARDDHEAAALAYGALSDADPAVREEAAYALGEIGGEMSLRALEQALEDPDPDVRASAIEALARIGGDQSAQSLSAVLDDPDPSMRAAAVDALGEIAGDTAMRLLQRAAADEEERVGGLAAELLAAHRLEH
jgi:HEAT repeat protein